MALLATTCFSALSLLLGAPAFAEGRWILVGEHYHSTTDIDFSQDPQGHTPPESYRPEGIAQLLARGQKMGLEAMIVTEHNSLAHCFDPLFNSSGNRLTLICGEEWTTHKSLHIGLLNPPVSREFPGYYPHDAKDVLPLPEVEAEARELISGLRQAAQSEGRLTLTVINHPGHAMYQPNDGLGADAAEAMVPDYEEKARSRIWWLNRLASGQRLVALGGSDYHACAGAWSCVRHGDVFRRLFDEPVNLVYAPSAAPNDILEAMRRGRVIALANAKQETAGIRIELSAESAGTDYLMGDVVSGLAPGDTVRVRARITGAKGLYAVLYGVGAPGPHPYTPLRDAQIDSEEVDTTFEVTRKDRPEAVHVELFVPDSWSGHDKSDPIAISNPIYF